MLKATRLAMLFVLSVFPAAAQTVAGQGATQSVIDACASGDPACRGAMGAYMDQLQRGGRSETFDQGIADLVVALADAASEDGKCDGRDKQLGLAISQAGAFAVNVSQRGQIDQIAEAVTACSEIQTASIMPIGDGLGPAGDAAAGGAASPN